MHQTLNHYQRELLKLGISEKDLDFSAPYIATLDAARKKDDEQEELGRLQQMRLKEFEAKCPPNYLDTDLKILSPKASEVINFPYGKRGLIVGGVSGRCKTRAMWLLVRRLYVEHGIGFEWFDALSFADGAIAAARDNTLAAHVKRLSRFPVLVLDDLGKARMTPKVGEALFGLIEARTSYNRPTYITTNFAGETLAARFEDEETSRPLLRRLREFSHVITL